MGLPSRLLFSSLLGQINRGIHPGRLADDNIEAVVADLKSRGVVFEEYDLPDFKTVNSIVTIGQIRAAYFKDIEGNLMGIAQFS